MLIKVKKTDISNALKKITGVVNSKSPILTNVLIEADDKIRLTATNIDTTIKVVCDGEIKEAGKAALPAIKLAQIIETFKDEITIKDNLVQEGKTKVKLDLADAEKFPIINSLESDVFFDLDMDILNDGLSKISSFTGEGILKGINVKNSDEGLKMCATDGNAMGVYIIDCDMPKINITIPDSTIKEILKSFSKIAKIIIGKTQIELQSESIIMQSSLLDSAFPAYENSIPVNNSKAVKIDKSFLIDSINRCKILSDSKNNCLEFQFAKNNLKIQHKDKLDENLKIKYEHEDLTITFNSEYLLRSIKNINDVEFNLEGSLKPLLIKEDNCTFIIMPVQMRA